MHRLVVVLLALSTIAVGKDRIQLVVQNGRPAGTDPKSVLAFKGDQAVWVRPDGKVDRAAGIKPVAGAVLSPDAKRWLRVRDGRLSLITAQGSKETEVAKGYDVEDGARWSADGRAIVFISRGNVHLYDSVTKQVQRLTRSLKPVTHPALDASGEWLVYRIGTDLVLKERYAHAERILARDVTHALCAWSPEGVLAWVDARGLHFYDTRDRKQIDRPLPCAAREIEGAAWMRSDARLALRRGRTLHLVSSAKSPQTRELPEGYTFGNLVWRPAIQFLMR